MKSLCKDKRIKSRESQTVILTLNKKDLASFETDKSAWVAEAGRYKILVGASSSDIRQKAEIDVPEELLIEKVEHILPADKQFEDLKFQQ
ncbi:fibronectin type III-like domain-contianing protein [Chryseobacterium sp. X308]|uniref:fibronectin type III-like domain-contianing protein n=1 Tax=Chryseobacterium sp. X308 TaxID=2884873 RepID=UPI003977E77B